MRAESPRPSFLISSFFISFYGILYGVLHCEQRSRSSMWLQETKEGEQLMVLPTVPFLICIERTGFPKGTTNGAGNLSWWRREIPISYLFSHASISIGIDRELTESAAKRSVQLRKKFLNYLAPQCVSGLRKCCGIDPNYRM